MTRCGNRGKPTAGFPPFPRTPGNRNISDFHIPTAPATVTYLKTKTKVKSKGLYGDRGKVEIQNQDFHFPTVPICLRRKEKTWWFAPWPYLAATAGRPPST
jgi:hypothetical protein